MLNFACPHFHACSGCEPQAIRLSEQQEIKLDHFISMAKIHGIWSAGCTAKIHNLGDGFLRTRFELTWQNDHWGFWSKEKNELLAIQDCHQLEPRLNEFYQKFKKISWPMRKASVRLRMSPESKFGIWLDLANEDVKALFEKGDALHECLKIAEVEVGQRRKRLVFEDGRFRLKDPLYQNWISTFVAGKEVFLASLVGGFSQTGPAATKVIALTLEKLLDTVNAKFILEFGSGFGTLTFPAAAQNKRRVIALEVDERSVEALRATAFKNKITSIEVVRGDFQRKKFAYLKSDEKSDEIDTYLVNPPRSGVQSLLLDIPLNVKNLIYMSCFEESFFKDSENLKAQGFALCESHLIDQFPQTPHTEWMTLWKRS